MTSRYRICRLNELEEGRPLGITIKGVPVGIFRVNDRCYAVGNICTHEQAFLTDGWQEHDTVECPLHQARFRVVDGKCLGPPAERDLQVFATEVEDGEVYVMTPEPAPEAG